MQNDSYEEELNWFTKAMIHFENDELTQALLSINFYCEENPENGLGLVAKAMIHSQLCDFQEAEKVLQSIDIANNSSPRFLKIYYTEMANLCEGRNDLSSAIGYYDKLIEIEPNNAHGYILKGTALAKLGQFEAAKLAHKIATSLSGAPNEAFANLGLILRAQLKLDEAKFAFEKSMSLSSGNINLKKNLEDVKKGIELQQKISSLKKAV